MPGRPPDRADMNTYRQRRLASARSTAYDLTSRVWNAAAQQYFGTTNARPDRNGSYMKTMPLVYWGQGTPEGRTLASANAEALTYGGKVGNRPIRMNLADLEALELDRQAMEYHGSGGRGTRAFKRGVQEANSQIIGTLLHELAHSQQVRWGSKLNTEGGADAFARLALPHIAQALGQASSPYATGYGDLYNRYLARRGENQALFGQFGQRGSVASRRAKSRAVRRRLR